MQAEQGDQCCGARRVFLIYSRLGASIDRDLIYDALMEARDASKVNDSGYSDDPGETG